METERWCTVHRFFISRGHRVGDQGDVPEYGCVSNELRISNETFYDMDSVNFLALKKLQNPLIINKN